MLLTHLDLHTKRRHHGFQDIDIQQGIMLQVAAHYRSKKCLGKASLCREQLGFYIERRYRVGAKALHSICKKARLGCASALCHQLAIEQNTDHSWPSQPTTPSDDANSRLSGLHHLLHEHGKEPLRKSILRLGDRPRLHGTHRDKKKQLGKAKQQAKSCQQKTGP